MGANGGKGGNVRRAIFTNFAKLGWVGIGIGIGSRNVGITGEQVGIEWQTAMKKASPRPDTMYRVPMA
jgi:hypothetical protein